MHEIIACPACARKVQLPREFLGRTVQCPECKQSFMAEDPAMALSAVPPAPAPPPPRELDITAPRGRYAVEDEPDEDEWARRPRTRDHGGLVLAMGILSVVLGCGLGIILGPIAWFVGGSDLAAIDRGDMDGSNRSMVQAGRIIGGVGFCLGILQALTIVAYFVFVIRALR